MHSGSDNKYLVAIKIANDYEVGRAGELPHNIPAEMISRSDLTASSVSFDTIFYFVMIARM